MKLEMVHPSYHITQAGSIARYCLAPGQHGHVLAAFEKAIYLQADSRELFWISLLESPMHRRCARAAPSLPDLSSGSSYQVDNRNVMFEKQVIIGLEQAVPWDEPGWDPAMAVSLLFPRIQTFFSDLDYSRARGFGTFIPQVRLLSRGEPTDRLPVPTDPVLAHAFPLVMDLARACLENCHSDISDYSKKLIGLGSGLTPSGDDFLGGMAFAIHILQSNYPDLDWPDFSSEVNYFQPRTHPISFALLSDLVHGHAITPLHQIMNDLLCGQSFNYLQPYIYQLTSIGHSTGWDLLAGLLTGLLTTSQCNHLNSSFNLDHKIETEEGSLWISNRR
jgi:hypothetical protein